VLIAAGIASLAVIVAACLVGFACRAGGVSLLRAGAVVAIVMALQLALAARGVLGDWSYVPPPIMAVIVVAVLLALAVALSAVGARMADRLPFALLVGYQSFRLPLELVMHRAATTGLMPVQMSFSGWNFDIVSGALAIPVAWLAASGRASRGLILAWNLVGTLLLANIVVIAVASTPIFAAFGPDRLNTWIADPPYIWLPGVLVPAALFGHVLTWRKLARGRRRLPNEGQAPQSISVRSAE
jgi:hypothetical protein